MDSNQLINNAEALRLFFNDDVYLVGGDIPVQQPSAEAVKPVEKVATAAATQPTETVAALPQVEEPTTAYKQTINFKHLGKNEKGILILVNDDQNPVSTPQGTELLRKLVLSINLKNADFALVNYSAYPTAKLEDLVSFFSCKLMFSFGVSPSNLGMANVNLHELNTINNIQTIFTHNLHQLDADLPAKKTLWGTLKKLSVNSGQ